MPYIKRDRKLNESIGQNKNEGKVKNYEESYYNSHGRDDSSGCYLNVFIDTAVVHKAMVKQLLGLQ